MRYVYGLGAMHAPLWDHLGCQVNQVSSKLQLAPHCHLPNQCLALELAPYCHLLNNKRQSKCQKSIHEQTEPRTCLVCQDGGTREGCSGGANVVGCQRPCHKPAGMQSVCMVPCWLLALLERQVITALCVACRGYVHS